ncbi:MAG: hypothetical protein QOE65_562 [Solirubrobacteraceae bacterium]|nr:hypothetical protein [Solirubrobacteraceae bacterium]
MAAPRSTSRRVRDAHRVARRRAAAPRSRRSAPRSELLVLGELNDRQVAEWRQLVRHAAEPNPFFDPDFVLPAAAGLRERVALLVARDDDGWCGALPVQSPVRARGWGHAPVRGLVAWTHRYCFLGTPLVRSGAETPATRTLVDAGRRAGFLGLDLLRPEGPVTRGLREAAGQTPAFPVLERAALLRGEDGWSLGLSRKRARDLARRRRRLSEAAGAELQTVDRAGDPDAIEDFLALEASGWKGARGTALASRPAHAELFRQVCRGFVRRGRLQLLSLRADGRSYAMLCSLAAGDTLFQFKIAFDEEHASAGPGIQVEGDHVATLDAAFPEARVVDTCADPSNEMANNLFPDRVRLERLAVPGPGLRGRADAKLVRAALGTRTAIRRCR